MTSLSSYGARALPAGSNAEWVHARFDRAVDIVQSLPRSGPIQTNYDDKLLLYSVYKQATEGDIKASRPGLLDVLGRAKWDAWNKRKGLSTEEAERLYVQGLLKILKGYSDRTQAVELIRELETFSLDPRAMVMSGSLAPSTSSSSTEGDTPQPLASSSHSHRRRQQPPVASSHRGHGQRTRPPHSTTSASVAPSLPGYGPPRTRADSPRRGGGSSSDGSGSEDYSSAEEEQRSRRAYGQQPLTPQQYPYGQHAQHSQQQQHSSQQLHPPAPSMPNRVLSPPLHPSQYPQHPQLQQLQQQQHQQFPPSPQHSFRGAPSPAPGLGAAPSIGQQVAVAYAPGMQRPPSQQPLQQQQRPPSQAPPPGLDAALDRIQTSLTALHERLAELERSRLSSSTSLSLSTSNPDSPLSLLRQTFLRLLVLLHLRRPSAQVVQAGLGKLLLRLLSSLVRVGRRVMGDLGVALVVLGLLARLSGRGQGVGMAELAGRLVGLIKMAGARKAEKRLVTN